MASNQELIRRFKVKPGGLVCDPFLGGGTNAVAANALGFDFIGCDTEEEAIKTSNERLSTVQREMTLDSNVGELTEDKTKQLEIHEEI